jgi:SulP family sulfate permease
MTPRVNAPRTPARRIGRGRKNESVSLTQVLQTDWREGASSWLTSWREVFSSNSLPQDVLAAFTVGAVALPLNLALAVASGLPPAAGLVAGAVGGVVAGVFGGTPKQVTGPAAALASMVAAIALGYGPVGVAAAALMVGVVQVLLAFTRAGHLARLVPESVLAGFTTGVGIKLLDQQLPELLGFDYRVSELASMMHRPEWLREVDWLAVVCGLFVALLVVATTRFKRFPAALVGIAFVTFVSNYVGFDIARVGEVPREFLVAKLPIVGATQWLDLFIAVLPLAILASAESLLASNAVDRMVKVTRPDARPHHPSVELFGQGLANIAVGFLSGMPVSGVVVRSGVNVQSGARTRLAAILHAVILGAAVVLVGDQIARTPLAALAGLLCVIGFRLLEFSTFLELVRHERLEAVAFVITLVGTVTGHLSAGLALGLAVHAVGRLWFHRGEAAERREISESNEPGTRAVLGGEYASARKLTRETTGSSATWLSQVRSQPQVPATAYVHPQASIIGHVVLGENVHVAAGSSLRADEGAPFFIGPSSNVQDGVVIHALKNKKVIVGNEAWAVYVGRNVSMAHDALIHGPCYIGDDTFIGFKAVVHDSVVGARCFVGIGAVVVGVEIPDERFVPHGTIVDSQSKVDSLPAVDAAQRHFNEDVVDVNRGLAAAYRRLHAPTSTGVPRAERPPEAAEAWSTPSFERF